MDLAVIGLTMTLTLCAPPQVEPECWESGVDPVGRGDGETG